MRAALPVARVQDPSGQARHGVAGAAGRVGARCQDGLVAKPKKTKEYWGDFWLESDPKRRVPGHLTFHPRRGGQLLLHSALRADARTMDYVNYPRILGKVLGRSCVLLDCFDSGTSSSEAGPGEWKVNARIFVNGMLTGPWQHAESPAERFVAATASFHGLPEFDGRMPFEHGRGDGDERDGEDRSVQELMTQHLTVKGLEWRTVETHRATIEFIQGTGSRGRTCRSETLISAHSMRVTPNQALPLDELIGLYSQARTLIAIALHQDCRFEGPIHLRPEPRPGDGDLDDAHMRSYEFHARWARGTRHSHELYNRVLSYESLGPDGIARWLALEDECGHVITRLSSLRYTRRIALEDALLRAVAAADSLHRLVYPREGWTKSRTMLKELAEYAGFPFRPAVPNLDGWAHAVVSKRDNTAHNKGRVVSEPILTTQLVDSVYFLVLVGLLRRAGASESAFEGLRHSQPFLWPMRAIFDQFGGDDWVLRMGNSRGTLGG